MACRTIKNYKIEKNVETKLTCKCSEAPDSTVHRSLITGLGCSLAASLVWAVLATTRPKWLRNLKSKFINFTDKIKSKTCSLGTDIDPNLPSTSEPNPAIQEPAASEPTPATQEPTAKDDNSPVTQKPPARISLKAPRPRPRARVCPYRRSEAQLRKKIKQETVEDLRQLIRLTKMEVQIEVANDLKAEADAEDRAKIEALFENP